MREHFARVGSGALLHPPCCGGEEIEGNAEYGTGCLDKVLFAAGRRGIAGGDELGGSGCSYLSIVQSGSSWTVYTVGACSFAYREKPRTLTTTTYRRSVPPVVVLGTDIDFQQLLFEVDVGVPVEVEAIRGLVHVAQPFKHELPRLLTYCAARHVLSGVEARPSPL